jgi:hypothetical protein
MGKYVACLLVNFDAYSHLSYLVYSTPHLQTQHVVSSRFDAKNITVRAVKTLRSTQFLEIARCFTLHSTGHVRTTLGIALQ